MSESLDATRAQVFLNLAALQRCKREGIRDTALDARIGTLAEVLQVHLVNVREHLNPYARSSDV
ncbi:hypothetical protein D6T65_05065 [Arthrobacter frigidicola]|nr:hypothetical protein D6T65_05065 [Arthrobacter frigidicola]